jgi:glycosyltransferase involved in cell wall biosynthesis
LTKPARNNSLFSISVVIPAYNAEQHIGRAIDSVLAQTHPADEIIVVDDGSTDDTCKVVQVYGNQVRYIYQENGGAGLARNTGIKASQGEWIAFLDADDEWVPEKLRLQTDHLRRHRDLVWSYGNMYYCWCRENRRHLVRTEMEAKKAVVRKEFFDSYFKAYVTGFCAYTINLIIKREILEQVGLFDVNQRRAQDTDMWFRIAYQWPEVGYVSEPLAIYHRQVPESITKTYVESKIIGDLVERHLRLSLEYGKVDEFRPCGIRMLQTWMRELILEGHTEEIEKRKAEILELAERFDDLLSWRFKSEMRLRAKYPRLGPWCIYIVWALKKLCGLFKPQKASGGS